MLNICLFPPICTGCFRVGEYICKNCAQAKITYIWQQCCHVCGQEVYRGYVHQECREYSYLDGVVSCCKYEGLLKGLLRDLKYSFYHKLAPTLADIMISRGVEHSNMFEGTILTFVPLARQRQWWRGFNQAQLFAQELAKFQQIPVIDLLIKRKGSPQAGLSRSHRLSNQKGKFSLRLGIGLPSGINKVIIIDDVYTTGATLEACAAQIKQKYQVEVYAFTLAHG